MKHFAAWCAAWLLLISTSPVFAGGPGQVQQQITQAFGAPVQVTGTPTDTWVLTYKDSTKRWEAAVIPTTAGGLPGTYARGDVLIATAADTLGRLAIGTTGKFMGTDGTDPAWKTLSGTTNQVTVSNSSGNLTIATPQNIHTAATPTFAGMTLTGSLGVGASSSVFWTTRSVMSSPADGTVLLTNTAADDFNFLKFGGTTSSFPSLKRSAQTLVSRLADDSADANFECAQLTTTDLITSSLGVQSGTSGTFSWSGRSVIKCAADGFVELTNQAQNGFSMLRFGGSLATFPALQRSSTTLIARLADDSADAPFKAASLILSGTALSPAYGGTGFLGGYTTGDLLTASGANSLTTIPAQATGKVLASAGTSTVPAYTSTPTVSTLSLSATSNQIVLQSAGVTGTFTATPTSTNKTWTMPDLTGTVALLNGGQTFTSATWQGTAIAAQYGGTGFNGASATNGSLPIGNGSGFTNATITAGNGLSVTNGSGSITPAVVGPYSCGVYNSAGQTLTHNTITNLTFDSESFDNGTMHSTGANTSRITVPVAGRYIMTGIVQIVFNATGVRSIYLYKNGSLYNILATHQAITTSPQQNCLSGSIVVSASANDYFELAAYQTSGGNLDTVGGSVNTNFSMALLPGQ